MPESGRHTEPPSSVTSAAEVGSPGGGMAGGSLQVTVISAISGLSGLTTILQPVILMCSIGSAPASDQWTPASCVT